MTRPPHSIERSNHGQSTQECRVTFPCYLPRPSECPAIGALFVTGGVRRFIPDHWLTEVELSEQGRLLRLTYTGCSVEVAGERLQALFEDAIVGRLGRLLQSPSMPELPEQPWISSIVAMVPAFADSRLDSR